VNFPKPNNLESNHLKNLFQFTLGPRDAKVVICGEAWGEQEALTKLPFQGKSGQELNRLLAEAGIDRKACFFTTVFNFRPPDNKIENCFTTKGEAGSGATREPPLKMGAYVKEQYLPELDRLQAQLEAIRPNLIIALGNTACWAILGTAKITALRGTVRLSDSGLKVLPTYHPSAILRNWALRPITLADLMKASREQHFPEIRRPARTVIVNPTLSDIRAYLEKTHDILSVDIETRCGAIECIGFASSRDFALVVPFATRDGDGSYWRTGGEELAAWEMVKILLERPMPKLFQNGLYDLQYITKMGIRPRNCTADTMLLHHAMYPEMLKGLGFLGSIYTSEPAWKMMRLDKHTAVKANE
jgi:DNA polymerase